MNWAESSSFLRIGAGSFATAYAWQSRSFLAVKQVADPSHALKLRQEFEDLRQLHEKCNGQLFKLTRPFGYYASYWEFALAMRLDRSVDRGLAAASMYTMQRVWPVPPQISADIIAEFFPDDMKGYQNGFVARLYLGRESSKLSRFFNPNNFQLSLPMMQHLNLPLDEIACDMGVVLAKIHYLIGKDGDDIEFILGGSSEDPYEATYFCIDFNRMTSHDGSVDDLARSFFRNDPYYPRPGKAYWDHFERGYMQQASEADSREVACQVVAEIKKFKAC